VVFELKIMMTRLPINTPTPVVSYLPETHPFQTVIVDVTHKCNMACNNCYIPNRDIPDMDVDWMCQVLARFPRRTRIRIVGAEATTRKDLPSIISQIRHLGHLPILLTNGLKIADRQYLKSLKQAGLRTIYLSFNGGFDDQMYLAVDGLACAAQKRKALENLVLENMYISLGMITVRGINEQQMETIFNFIKEIKQVYEFSIRSVGQFGRYMETQSFMLPELIQLFAKSSGISAEWIEAQQVHESYIDFLIGKLKIQLTQWPDLGSDRRGRLAPDGTIHQFFEHVIANEGGY
jgi:uncharacterized radical SAM superfamily Fe-S cluster-containing enzyme